MCLNTKGFTTDEIKSDFYLISGTKPYDKKSPRNIEIEHMSIPQLQWTAMCCRMKIGSQHDITMSGGYITSNRKPDFQIENDDEGGKVFPMFPPHDEEMMDLPMLRRGLNEKFEDGTDWGKEDVIMSADHIFGNKNPADVQERSNEWIINVIKGLFSFNYLLIRLTAPSVFIVLLRAIFPAQTRKVVN